MVQPCFTVIKIQCKTTDDYTALKKCDRDDKKYTTQMRKTHPLIDPYTIMVETQREVNKKFFSKEECIGFNDMQNEKEDGVRRTLSFE